MVFRLARFRSPAPGAFIRRVSIVGAAKKLTLGRAFTIEKISSGAKRPLSGMTVARRLGDVREREQPRAVRDRRGLDERVAGLDVIDVGEVGHGHGHERAMGQGRPFRPAGGAAGVEQPRGNRPGRRTPCPLPGPVAIGLVVGIVDTHDGVESVQVFGETRDALDQIGGDEAESGPGVVEDVGELVRMQLCVDGDCHQPGVPCAEERLEELRAVGHRERDACPRRAAPGTKSRRDRRSARPRAGP